MAFDAGARATGTAHGKKNFVTASTSAKAIPLTIPAIQNWSCQNCTACCRHHAIEVTEEERQRILSQRWTEQDGTPTGEALFERQAGKGCWLAHRADGACVFLNERGLCRIHAKFGEAAKPRACRVFPFAFHPAGKKVAVSMRFSCPAVAANRGRALSQRRDEIQRLARAVVPGGHDRIPAPALVGLKPLEWPQFMPVIDALDEALAAGDAPMALKLQQALSWLTLVESHLDKLAGERVPELLAFLRQAACNKVAEESAAPTTGGAPSAIAKLMFRLLVFQYARKDTAADLSAGWGRRLELLIGALRMARGAGRLPALQEAFKEVPFKSIEQPFGAAPECEELWTRYFRVKVQGLHFCGPAYHGLSLVEGFQNLALIFPVTMWIARWLAAGQNRTQLTQEDLAQALTISDHHHGYSPIFGSFGFRSRVQVLAQWGEIPKLIRWSAQ